MFQSLRSDHPALYVVMVTALHLFVFMAIVIAVVCVLRGPLKKYKMYDLNIFRQIQPLRSATNSNLMQDITFLGKHQFLVPANLLLIAVFFFFSKRHWYVFNILVISLSSLLMMLSFKKLSSRKRPDGPLLFAAKGMSFPSGHAMMSVSFYGLLLHIMLQYISSPGLQIIAGVVCVGLIFFIGFSRVYLQVHYLSDVLAGFIIGVAWLFVALQLFGKLQEVS